MKRTDPSIESKLGRLADLFLVSGALATAALFGYAVSRSPAGVTTAQLLLYFAIPLLLAVLFAVSLFQSPSLKANLTLIVVSVGFSLVVTELVLALMPPPDVARDVAEASGGAVDARNALSVARDLTSDGALAFPHVSSSAARGLPVIVDGKEIVTLSGAVSNTKTVFCNESGQWDVYLSDEYGFNNDPGAWGGSPPEVVLIGDSYTQGTCFSRDRAMVAVLREAWPSMLNLGVSGAGPLSELAILHEYVVDLEPEIVVWLYYEGNDLPDLAGEMTDPTLNRYLEDGFRQQIMAHQDSIDEELRARLEAITRPAGGSEAETEHGDRLYGDFGWDGGWLQLLRLNRVQSLMLGATIPLPSSGSRLRLLPRVMEEAVKTVRGWGGELYFVFLPEYSRYNSMVGERGIERQEVLELVQQLEIPLIDLVEVFDELDAPRSVWLHPAGHYDEDGYRMVADVIAEQIAH